MCHIWQVFTCIILDIHSILLSLFFIIFFSCFEVSHMYEFFTRNIFFCDFSVVCLLFIYHFLVEWIVCFFFLFKIPSIKESSTSTTWRLSIFQKIQSMGICTREKILPCHARSRENLGAQFLDIMNNVPVWPKDCCLEFKICWV